MSSTERSLHSQRVDNDGIIQLGPTVEIQVENELILSATVPDFARKLYNLLEDPQNHSVVQWGPLRDCFIVKNTNEFSKTVLPRVFNHSNFASFVRQLNKYGFHKVKTTEFNQNGDQTWTFQHRDFHGDRIESLQHIKRKAPTSSASSAGTSSGSLLSNRSTSESSLPLSHGSSKHQLQSRSQSNLVPPYSNSKPNESDPAVPSDSEIMHEVNHLKEENEDLKTRARNLERNYESMTAKMKKVEDALAHQNNRMDWLLQQLMDNSPEQGVPTNDSMTSMAISTASPVDPRANSTFAGRMDSPNQMTYQQAQRFLRGSPSRLDNRGTLTPESPPVSMPLDHRQPEQYKPRQIVSERTPVSPFQESSPSPTRLSVFSNPRFGSLGQVGRATLLQSRESNRQLVAELEAFANTGTPDDSRLWARPSHGGEERLPHPIVPEQLSATSSTLPSPVDRQLSEHLRAVTIQQQPAFTTEAGWNLGTLQSPTFGTHFDRSSIDPASQNVGNKTRRRGRSQSLGEGRDALQHLPAGRRDSEGWDPVNNLMGSPEQRAERGRVMRERRRRGSDSVVFVPRGRTDIQRTVDVQRSSGSSDITDSPLTELGLLAEMQSLPSNNAAYSRPVEDGDTAYRHGGSMSLD